MSARTRSTHDNANKRPIRGLASWRHCGRSSLGRIPQELRLPRVKVATGWAISATACSDDCASMTTTSAGLTTANRISAVKSPIATVAIRRSWRVCGARSLSLRLPFGLRFAVRCGWNVTAKPSLLCLVGFASNTDVTWGIGYEEASRFHRCGCGRRRLLGTGICRRLGIPGIQGTAAGGSGTELDRPVHRRQWRLGLGER